MERNNARLRTSDTPIQTITKTNMQPMQQSACLSALLYRLQQVRIQLYGGCLINEI